MNRVLAALALSLTLVASACQDGGGGGSPTQSSIVVADNLPPAGAGNDSIGVPADGHAADSSTPTTVVGDGTPASCTSDAFVAAVLKGGVITFNCGATPYTIELTATVRVHNLHTREVIIDGGGLITLSGAGARRILYQNSCDADLGIAEGNTRCDLDDYPRTTVQHLTFVNGYTDDDEGGGAIFVRGGHFKIVDCRFFHNTSGRAGPDVGGGAVRITGLDTSDPVYIVQSTFGGAGDLGNMAANGGGLSGLFASFAIYNTFFQNNRTTSCCGNPIESGAGGGSGGAIYMDGLKLRLSIYGSRLADNSCQAHGSAIFFVSNDHQGVLTIDGSAFSNNAEGEGHWYPIVPDISMHDDTETHVTNTTFE
jgi:hypothetical protein